nr:MAG TPA: hypothetical protein [Caudoviricetes sp.]
MVGVWCGGWVRAWCVVCCWLWIAWGGVVDSWVVGVWIAWGGGVDSWVVWVCLCVSRETLCVVWRVFVVCVVSGVWVVFVVWGVSGV